MDPTWVPPERQWIVPGLLMAGKINGLFGAEKAGKSRLLAWLLAHAYQALPVLGMPTMSPGKTLYLAGEEQQEEVAARLRLYSTQLGMPWPGLDWGATITFCDATGMRLDLASQREWLSGMLATGYKCIVIDPLRRVHGARENQNDEMAPLLNTLRTWSNKLGVTVVLVHHTGKLREEEDEERIASWSRGASDLPAILDWAAYLKRGRSPKARVDHVLIRRRGRATPLDNLKLEDLMDQGLIWRLAP